MKQKLLSMRRLKKSEPHPPLMCGLCEGGKWKRVVDYTGVEAFGFKETMVVGWGCSACGYEVDVSEESFNFCPNCGADMREANDEKA
jgi:hypothetical protein